MTEKELIESILPSLETYGLSGVVPGVKDISAMKSLLSIGGVLLFIPYKDGFSITHTKDVSNLDANNNAVYSDGFVQRPSEVKGKSFIPSQFNLVNYIALYTVFRSVYRNSNVADAGDIVLNMLYEWVKEWRKTPTKTNDKGDILINDWLLSIIDALQKGVTIEQVSSLGERAKAGKAALTSNSALYEEFIQSRDNIFQKYTTLFTSYTLEKTQDTISIFSAGKLNSLSGAFKTFTNAAENVLVFPSEFFELFYDMVILMFKYSTVPMPIHIPKKGWCFGTDREVTFFHSSKAGNVTLVDVSLTIQEVLSSTFIDITEEKKINKPIPTPKKDSSPKQGRCASVGTLKQIGSVGVKKGFPVNADSIEQFCSIYASDGAGGFDKNLAKGFNDFGESFSNKDFQGSTAAFSQPITPGKTFMGSLTLPGALGIVTQTEAKNNVDAMLKARSSTAGGSSSQISKTFQDTANNIPGLIGKN